MALPHYFGQWLIQQLVLPTELYVKIEFSGTTLQAVMTEFKKIRRSTLEPGTKICTDINFFLHVAIQRWQQLSVFPSVVQKWLGWYAVLEFNVPLDTV